MRHLLGATLEESQRLSQLGCSRVLTLCHGWFRRSLQRQPLFVLRPSSCYEIVNDWRRPRRRGMSLEQMMKQHPEATQVDLETLVECIERSSACEAACVSCADACLSEAAYNSSLTASEADLCGVTVRLLSRHSSREPRVLHDALLACIVGCIACAEECRRCAQSCEDLRALLPRDSNFT